MAKQTRTNTSTKRTRSSSPSLKGQHTRVRVKYGW